MNYDGTMQDQKAHWQAVYESKAPTEFSWFKPHLDVSLDLLRKAGLNENSRVLDVGSGASTLVDDLLELGVRDVTALDLAEASLAVARKRLGQRARAVRWIEADIRNVNLPPGSIDLWHDRAALHFLVEPAAADAYVRVAASAIVDGGHAVIGCFAADGPDKCSGLPVMRRDPADIARLFGPAFVLLDERREVHSTPSGSLQRFAYALLRKK